MEKIYRGTIINPLSSEKSDYYQDGGILINKGKIVEIGQFDELKKKFPDVNNIDETKGIILPAFTDIHVHGVQNQVKGSFGGNLLPWLKDHIWPEEDKFKDAEYAKKMFESFYDELALNGTRNAVIYSSIHREATEIAFELAKDKGNFIIGNVLMDQNSPDYLQVSTADEIEMVEYFAEKFQDQYVVTPRFAPTCSMKLMEEVGKIARNNGCFIQTHLSENKDEIKWVNELFPEQKNYTKVYEQAGLLGEKTILGHSIHLSDQEWMIIKKTGTKIAHCPTSNIALGSGRMPVEKLFFYDIPFALASDVGAGPKLNMIDVMKSYIDIHKQAKEKQQNKGMKKTEATIPEISYTEALYRATLAGAEIMQLDEKHGNLIAGKEAEFVVIKGFSADSSAEETLKKIIETPCDEIDLVLIS